MKYQILLDPPKSPFVRGVVGIDKYLKSQQITFQTTSNSLTNGTEAKKRVKEVMMQI